MTAKELRNKLRSNPEYALHLAVVNNPGAITNALMSNQTIQGEVSEQALYEILVGMYQSGDIDSLRYILGNVPYLPGQLPVGYDELLIGGQPTRRSGNNVGGTQGAWYENVDWNDALDTIGGILGPLINPAPDAPPPPNWQPTSQPAATAPGVDTNSIIVYGGIGIMLIVVLVVVFKLIK
jgi:hypothetical protein